MVLNSPLQSLTVPNSPYNLEFLTSVLLKGPAYCSALISVHQGSKESFFGNGFDNKKDDVATAAVVKAKYI